jgi:hypothetical protein
LDIHEISGKRITVFRLRNEATLDFLYPIVIFLEVSLPSIFRGYSDFEISCISLFYPINSVFSMYKITNVPSWFHLAHVSRMPTKQFSISLIELPDSLFDSPWSIDRITPYLFFVRGNIIETYRTIMRSAPHKMQRMNMFRVWYFSPVLPSNCFHYAFAKRNRI